MMTISENMLLNLNKKITLYDGIYRTKWSSFMIPINHIFCYQHVHNTAAFPDFSQYGDRIIRHVL